MEWHDWYGPDHSPTFEEIQAFIASGLWAKARNTLETTFEITPRLEYSRCSMQKGWNVKYKKNGRALCTLYPKAGHFLAMIVIGQREELHMGGALNNLSGETRALYLRTEPAMGSRWLMLKVDTDEALADLLLLVGLRAAS